MTEMLKIKTPSVFISYAWEHDKEKNTKLQEFLKQLYLDLSLAGIKVYLDIINARSDLEGFMKTGVLNCDIVFLIGTPTLKMKLKDESQNVSIEYKYIEQKLLLKSDFLFPLLYAFDTSFSPISYEQKILSSYPDRFSKFIVRDFTDNLDFIKYSDNLLSSAPSGLIPSIFNINYIEDRYSEYLNMFKIERDLLIKD